jgi:hypothetical protein
MIASVPSRVLLGALLFTACRREDVMQTPPPLPEAPPPVAERAEPAMHEPHEPRAPEHVAKPSSASKPASKALSRPITKTSAKPKSKTTGAAYVPPPYVPPAYVPPPMPKPAPAPAPVAQVPAPAARPKTHVSIPRTEHVHVDIPAGLQTDLDADPRMQSWVDQVIAIADRCHGQARGNVGAIDALITMHENARPDADMRGLPPQLGGLVACATGALMRTKMPLFTGREGTRYPVRIVFE